MRARFRVRYTNESKSWICCKPLNEAATEIIHGKKIALWPGPRKPEVYVPFVYEKKKKVKYL